ncbi:MAG: ABC transporter permease [Planctomycetota bacterium]
MFRLAFKNLFQSPARLIVSIGGVALALLLILALDAILAGSERLMTAYIDNSGADVFVAQKGVRNMHMASSSLPGDLVETVAAMEEVESVSPILYLTNVIDVGEQQYLAYIIGVDPDAPTGRAWELIEGRTDPDMGEIVIDRTVASKSNLEIGDSVDVLGRSFEIVGLAKGTASIINSVAFIHLEDFFVQRGTNQVISYLLVQIAEGASASTVARRIEREVDDVTALPRSEFSIEEASIIQDMGGDIIVLMNSIGFLIGLAVTGLTTYTATLSRRKEYGMLKALGASNIHLYLTVVWQTMISIGLGLALAIGLTFVLGYVVPIVTPEMELVLTGETLIKTILAAGAIALVSALLPIRQISGLDPAAVFRR